MTEPTNTNVDVLLSAVRGDMSNELNINGEYTDIDSCVLCGIRWREDSTEEYGMIGCDICQRWYHGCCVGININIINDALFYCDSCRLQRSMPLNSKDQPIVNLRTQRLTQIDNLLNNKTKRDKLVQQLSDDQHPSTVHTTAVYNKLIDSLQHDSSDDSTDDDDNHENSKQRNDKINTSTRVQQSPSQLKHKQVPASTIDTNKSLLPNQIKRRTSTNTSSATSTTNKSPSVSNPLIGIAADSIRDKVRHQLCSILNESIGNEIEQFMYEQIDHNAVSTGYRQYFRDLIANLRDINNAQLKQRILSGDLPSYQLIHMSATQLASPEITQLRQSIKEDSLKMSILPDDTFHNKHKHPHSNDANDADNNNQSLINQQSNIAIDTSAHSASNISQNDMSPHQPSVSQSDSVNNDILHDFDVDQLESLHSFDEVNDIEPHDNSISIPQLEHSPSHKSTNVSTQNKLTDFKFELSEQLSIQHRSIWSGQLCIPSTSHTINNHQLSRSIDIPLHCEQLCGIALSSAPLPRVLSERHRISITDAQQYITQVVQKSSSKRVVCVEFVCNDNSYHNYINQIVQYYSDQRAMVFDYQNVENNSDKCLLYIMSNHALSNTFLSSVLNITRPNQLLIGICVMAIDVCIQHQLPLQLIPLATPQQTQAHQPGSALQSVKSHTATSARPYDPRAPKRDRAESNNDQVVTHPYTAHDGITTHTPAAVHDISVNALPASNTESLTNLSHYLQSLISTNNAPNATHNTSHQHTSPSIHSIAPQSQPQSQFHSLPYSMPPPPLTPAQFAMMHQHKQLNSVTPPQPIYHQNNYNAYSTFSAIQPNQYNLMNNVISYPPSHQPMQSQPHTIPIQRNIQPTIHHNNKHTYQSDSYESTDITPSSYSDSKRVKHSSVSIDPRLARLLLENHLCKFYFTQSCSKDNCNYSHDRMLYDNVIANKYHK